MKVFMLLFFCSIQSFASDDHAHPAVQTTQCSVDEPNCSDKKHEHTGEESEDEHGHSSEKHKDHKHADGGQGHEAGDDPDDHEGGHVEGEEHDDHEEGAAAVGPDKGIIENGEKGFKLSKEAIANFNLKFEPVVSPETILPRNAVVYIKNGEFVYFVRNEWIRRVPIKITHKSEAGVKITSSEIVNGDQIVTSGAGFVRGAELILSEGATHSH